VKRAIALFAAALAVTFSGAAAARPLLDCPLRDAPFSASSPLIDLLLSPRAKAVVERELGRSFDQAPPRFAGTKAPTFAAILSLHEAAGILRADPQAVGRAAAALRLIPITSADRAARCERYDDERPRFILPKGKPRVLLFEKMTGFRDGPSVDAAHAAFLELARTRGWAIVSTDKGGAIRPATLRQFDAVIWNNVSGDVLTLTQRRALQRFVEGGGGFVAVHGSAGDPVYFWDWYVDRLIGARFAWHPIAKQVQDARVVVDARSSPVARGLPPEWTMNDEWYSFKTNPRQAGATVIATLDERSYAPEGMAGQNRRMGDHPIAWTNCVGQGRMFYSAIGHRPETYAHSLYRQMLVNAVEWAAGSRSCHRR
jgi:type 1 glutamine amidotransferase